MRGPTGHAVSGHARLGGAGTGQRWAGPHDSERTPAPAPRSKSSPLPRLAKISALPAQNTGHRYSTAIGHGSSRVCGHRQRSSCGWNAVLAAGPTEHICSSPVPPPSRLPRARSTNGSDRGKCDLTINPQPRQCSRLRQARLTPVLRTVSHIEQSVLPCGTNPEAVCLSRSTLHLQSTSE